MMMIYIYLLFVKQGRRRRLSSDIYGSIYIGFGTRAGAIASDVCTTLYVPTCRTVLKHLMMSLMGKGLRRVIIFAYAGGHIGL